MKYDHIYVYILVLGFFFLARLSSCSLETGLKLTTTPSLASDSLNFPDLLMNSGTPVGCYHTELHYVFF